MAAEPLAMCYPAGWRHFEGRLTPRFRTIQVCPKDKPARLLQAEDAVVRPLGGGRARAHYLLSSLAWYTGTLYNRLERKGAIVIIGHRTHQDDLQGRLLAQQAAGGDRWTVVELKALSASGDALWPEKFDSEALARIKANTTAQDWAALYQQEPTQEVGSYFKEDWLVPILDLPPGSVLNVYGASDYAVTCNGGDFTVHVVIGIDPKRRMFLLDLWRQQTSSNVWIEAWCDLVTKWKPAFWAEEKTQITSGVGPFITARARERQAYTKREQFPTRHDKAVRAQSIRGRMELDGFYVPARAPWLADLKAELLAFPTGKHDDQVDALGLVGQLLDKWAPGGVPKLEPGAFRPPPIDYVALYPKPDEPLLNVKIL